ncbi:glycosyltransferase [Pseudoalteromonas luteoviolacea]|uniref:glycosyltransferase n=1 Tax=Pseudoalteromonas luteoviolacea TaxID=43657 RepID=UPI00114FA55E|nr:glycosyltransferase [Pseudoalteromonas luteoviolacea]TQF69913.1 glycosyltransferase [Pseudoalteromonas luteoviolacea]
MEYKFSIITPIYNATAYVGPFIEHVKSIVAAYTNVEWIIVDDGSQDDTAEQLEKSLIQSLQNRAIKLVKSTKNQGPGSARNIAIDHATGDWLLFIDADDVWQHQGLAQLLNFLNSDAANDDVVSFSWADSRSPLTKLKKDRASLIKSKTELVEDYLSLKMDGSVIFSAIKRSLVTDNQIRFASGYHEDVDFLLKVYWFSKSLRVFDEIVYIKDSRENSIVNSVSLKHIEGFARAYSEIRSFLKIKQCFSQFELSFYSGIIAIAATRIRNTQNFLHLNEQQTAQILLALKAQVCTSLPNSYEFNTTQYHKLTQLLLTFESFETKANQVDFFSRVQEIAVSTWSCKDLEHSLFLAPSEVRACCKRFFVGSEIRGDVTLIKDIQDNITIEEIKAAKVKLKTALNNGSETDCDGCPYLEFKDWGRNNLEKVKYLSLEHHSVCNLKCSYCDEKYYGGKKSTYDIKALLTSKEGAEYLHDCENVVWGGGEPSLGRDFDSLLPQVIEDAPKAVHRVLSNSVKFSPTIEQSLINKNVKVVTSIDAGTDETFLSVRGKSKLSEVIENLAKYAKVSSENITIKYILRPDNSAFTEIRAYLDKLNEHPELKACNFQISCDFKDEILDHQVICAAVLLFGLLLKSGYTTIFFDDLLRARLSSITNADFKSVRELLTIHGYKDFLADLHDTQEIIIWGTGWQSKFLLENSLFFENTKVAFFVVDKEFITSDTFMDRPVLAPEKILESDLPVLIAASQSYEQIKKRFVRLNIPEERIFKKAII